MIPLSEDEGGVTKKQVNVSTVSMAFRNFATRSDMSGWY